MIGRFVLSVLCMAVAVGGCSNGDTVTVTHNAEDGGSWANWHAEKRSVDRVADAAINQPGGGDYAKAADAIRGSSRPPAVKQFEMGQLIVGGIMDDAPRRPPEDLEQGLRMMEDSNVTAGQKDEGAVQQLRFLFERGDGKPPHGFPTDPQVAACWLAVEERRSDDPAGCIILRRSRMPHVGG
jgi:hypothetical protein